MNKYGEVYNFMSAVGILIILICIIAIVSLYTYAINKDIKRANEIQVAETTEYTDQSASTPIGMEKVSGVRGAITTVNMNFYYYRETATDVMYIVCFNSTGAGITPMVNPDTRLPMKYSEYLKLVK